MKKYGYSMISEIKKSIVYKGDTWLTAVFAVFSVALAYLLWKAVFGPSELLNGFTLPEMTTYYLLTGLITPLTQSNAMVHEFSEQIKTGQYAKYLVKPVSPLGYFIAASLGKLILPTIISSFVLAASFIFGSRYFEPMELMNIVRALPVICLGTFLNIVIGYMISMVTFRLTDIGFLFAIEHILKVFLSGSLIPLTMVFGETIPMYLPFSYTLYYPVMLSMGKSSIGMFAAVGILLAWIGVMLCISLFLEKRASKTFEGVGI